MATRLPILMFHTLDHGSTPISFAPGVFQQAIQRLYESGYRTVSLLEAVEYLKHGMGFPDRCLAITFDDGYQTVYDVAFPTLQSCGISATVFLTVGKGERRQPGEPLPPIEGHPMLTWDQIREMHQFGIDFGAHTLTHPDLTRLSSRQVEAEVITSKAVIEDVLGTSTDCFAYPYGRYDRRSREIVARHFACACSDKLGLVTANSDRHALERVDAYYLRTNRLFGVMLTRLFPWYVRARSIPRRIRRLARLRRAR